MFLIPFSAHELSPGSQTFSVPVSGRQWSRVSAEILRCDPQKGESGLPGSPPLWPGAGPAPACAPRAAGPGATRSPLRFSLPLPPSPSLPDSWELIRTAASGVPGQPVCLERHSLATNSWPLPGTARTLTFPSLLTRPARPPAHGFLTALPPLLGRRGSEAPLVPSPHVALPR